jgi:hypothetical protein
MNLASLEPVHTGPADIPVFLRHVAMINWTEPRACAFACHGLISETQLFISFWLQHDILIDSIGLGHPAVGANPPNSN